MAKEEIFNLTTVHPFRRFNFSGLQPGLEERAQIILTQPVAIISLLLCFLSICANLLSITATILGPSGMITHIKLIVSLGVSDIILSISVVSHTLNKVFTPVPHPLEASDDEKLSFFCITIFLFALHTMATVISLLNLLAMAIDHYIAIMRPLHYVQYLSRTRGNIIIITIWVFAIIGGFAVFISDFRDYHGSKGYQNYCHYLQDSDFQGEYLVLAVAFITFFVVIYTYLRIYIEVRRVNRHGPSARMDYLRNRKALLTTLLIIGTFVLCWLPTCLLQIALTIQVHVDRDVVSRQYGTFLRLNRYLNTLLLVNTLCDPIVYAVRLRDVQLGYRRLFQKCSFFRPKRRGSFRMSQSFERRNTQIARLLTMDSIGSQTQTEGIGHESENGCDPMLHHESSNNSPQKVGTGNTDKDCCTDTNGDVQYGHIITKE